MTKKEQRVERAHDLADVITLEFCGEALLQALLAFRKAYGKADLQGYERDFDTLSAAGRVVAQVTYDNFKLKFSIMQEMGK